MKLKCTQENLAKALSIVGKAVSVKASLPILGNVLFTAKDGACSLAASNLETSILMQLPAAIETEGSLAVPAKLVTEFVNTLPAGNLDFFSEGSAVKIVAAGSSAKFTCMPAEDFPAIPAAKEGVGISLDPKDFGFAVLACAFCAAVGDSRPALTGILLKKTGANFIVVATDGFRLSEKIISLDGKVAEGADLALLVPAKTLAEVARLFASAEEELKLVYSESENLAVFVCEGVTVSIRILDGEFPNYKGIIPVNPVLSARVNTADLLQALKIANVFAKDAKEGNNLLRLTLDPAGDCLVYSA
ncbi:MAG: DNA polymerase III subunit beta, partial [bacterium]